MDKAICLTEDLLIGKGSHKNVYVDPSNASRCIKILHKTPDSDITRELEYRYIREKRHLVSRLLPIYYGTIQTSLGLGYIFERVTDFDGNDSKTLRQLFDEAENDANLAFFLADVLQSFKSQLFQELLVTSDVDPNNFMFQRISVTEYRIRVVDNIGSPVFLPLAFYFDVIAKRRLKKYWQRFLDEMQRKYPNVLSEETKLRLW